MTEFKPMGVCARKIKFKINEEKIEKVVFEGGCPGNLIGLSKLLEGMEVNDAIDKFSGIRCGGKSTSCPDQLSIALKKLSA